MFTIIVNASFEASHSLEFKNSPPEKKHSHIWNLQAAVSRNELDENSLVMDFHKLKSLINKITEPLGGQYLNDLGIFENKNTSAENLAQHIFLKLSEKLPTSVKLEYIQLSEDKGCFARFSK